jgi:CHAD domain-containing protein
MAKARPIPGIGPELPMREAAARTIAVRTEEVFEHAAGVLDTSDIERVHDMRVATRRLRAALEVFESCFPKREFKRTLRDVKRLADALGMRRDPDVALAMIDGIGAKLSSSDRAGIRSFEGELRGDQSTGNRELEIALAEATATQLESRLIALSEIARVPA